MAGSGPAPGDVFDVRKIRRLVELMREYDLNAVDLQSGEQRIRLRRGAEPIAIPTFAPAAVPTAAPASAAPASPQTSDKAGGESVGDAIFIKSPMVGTFYTAANPESAPFVKIGDQIGPESTICIIEAMKVFNEIPAETTGQIAQVLVSNGDPVEFGQPLFTITKP